VRRDDEIVFPLVLGNSSTEVLSVDNKTFEAWVGSHSSGEILDHSHWQSGVHLEQLITLASCGSDHILDAKGAGGREHIQLVEISGCLS